MAVVRNSIYLIVANCVALLIQFISIPIVLRCIGKSAFGTFTIIAVIAGYISVIVPDFSAATQKYLTEAISAGSSNQALRVTSLHRRAIAIGGIVTLALFSLLCLYGPSIERGISEATLYAMFVLAGIQNVVFLLASRYTVILFATESFKQIAILQAIGSILSAIVSLTVSYIFRTPIGLSVGAMLTPIVTLVAASIAVRRRYRDLLVPVPFDRSLFGNMAKVTFKAYPNSLILSVSGGADRLLIKSAGLPAKYVTEYNIPYRLPEMLVNLLNPILMAIVPNLTRQNTVSDEVFSGTVKKYSLTSLWLATSFVLVPSAFGGSFLKLWLGKMAPIDGEYVVAFIGLYMCLNFFYNSLVKAFVSKGEMHLVAPFSLFNALATLAISVPAVRYGGIAGLALMNACINSVIFVPFIAWTLKKAAKYIDYKKYLATAALIVAQSLLLALVAFWLTNRGILAEYPTVSLLISPIFITLSALIPIGLRLVEVPTSVREKMNNISSRFRR